MAGAGTHVDNIGPILLSAGLVEGYIFGGDETVESSKSVLSIVVASVLRTQEPGFDNSSKIFQFHYLRFYKFHVSCSNERVKKKKKNREAKIFELRMLSYMTKICT